MLIFVSRCVYVPTCVYQEHTLSLTAVWTRKHGAMAASAVSVFWMWSLITLLLVMSYCFCISTYSSNPKGLNCIHLLLQELMQLLHLNIKHFSVIIGYFFLGNGHKLYQENCFSLNYYFFL